ncbi:MAG TPA: CRISPR-associated endonuclease Cas1 [Candidatus Paceibacterota bacterium]|nr:CRISPR-associated endonuclease Cas1 [Candidatus Paceibacterota bacterium]
MNSLWLERMASYRATPLALASAKVLVELKDARRTHLLKRYKLDMPHMPYNGIETYEQILLREARNAKTFWAIYARLLPPWCAGFKRQPRNGDIINSLLDVGYHHLANKLEKIITEKDISPSLSLIHRAHSANSKPLIYDLMEMFRADLVDFVLLKFLRLKKKPIQNTQEHIGRFLSEINKTIDAPHYLKDFKQCLPYRYYMELQVVKFIKAVNRREVFEPLLLPRRHDSRCACNTSTTPVDSIKTL